MISIILPAFNRRLTIMRAVQSALDQTLTDWELIVVDDGSTDGTAEEIEGIDARVRVVRTANKGAAAARNIGIAQSRGDFIAFLDSDDEWLPHFLALTHAFMERHPGEQFVATEFLHRHADGATHVQDRSAIRDDYAPLARQVGSTQLELPAGVTDDYERIYETHEPLEAWWKSLVSQAHAPLDAPIWYRGKIDEHYRWGHLHALWCILFRREAVLSVGPFNEARRSCNDLAFLVNLCRRYPANMLSIPSVIKHQLLPAQVGKSAAHLASGAGYFTFARNYAEVYGELFMSNGSSDPVTRRLYGHRCLSAARAALALRDQKSARRFFALAAEHLGGSLRMRMLATVARVTPSGRTGTILARLYEELDSRTRRVWHLLSAP